jgi:hypothetical protein
MMGILSYVDWCAANQLNTQQTPSKEISVTGARISIEEWSKNSQKISVSIS